MVFSFYWT